MNLSTLILRQIKHRPLPALMSVLILAVALATLMSWHGIHQQVRSQMLADIQGVDLVLGAKGSPLQIILSSVYHIDTPTGNIPLKDANQWAQHPQVRRAVPLALGDSYKGFRIVGTSAAMLEHYQAEFAHGQLWQDAMQVVLGAEVAATTNAKMGDKIVGSHGLTDGGEAHGDLPYVVVGILKPTGRVVDRLVLTDVKSVWHVHDEHDHAAEDHEVAHEDAHEHEHDDHQHEEDHAHAHDDEHEAHEENKEITAMLLTFKSLVSAAMLPRQINQSATLQAANPAFETARLVRITGSAGAILQLFGIILAVFAALSFFMTQTHAVSERTYDFALLRSLGASRNFLAKLVLLEVVLMALAAIVVGFVMTHIIYAVVVVAAANQHVVFNWPSVGMFDAVMMVCALLLSVLATIMPLMRVLRLNVVAVLKSR